MRKNTLIALLFVLVLGQIHPAMGFSGREGNGGDDEALAIESVLRSAQLWVQARKESIPEFQVTEWGHLLDPATIKILVSDEPVLVEDNGHAYEVAAKNLHEPDRIIFNRPRWQGTRSDALRVGLLIHELLGLAGLESTGDYRFTALFFRELGLSCERGICFERSTISVDSMARLKAHLMNNGPWEKTFASGGITVEQTLEFRENSIVVSALCRWSEIGRENVFARTETPINYLEGAVQYLEARAQEQTSAAGDRCFVFFQQTTVPVLVVSAERLILGGENFTAAKRPLFSR